MVRLLFFFSFWGRCALFRASLLDNSFLFMVSFSRKGLGIVDFDVKKEDFDGTSLLRAMWDRFDRKSGRR